MPGPDGLQRRRVGSLLVALQLGLLAALLLLAWLAGPVDRVPGPAWGLAAAGVGLGLWALAANRPGNFNIRPAPREGGQLVQRGPYRWIRHPMYSALMVWGLGCAWAGASAVAWLCLVGLVVVLVIKATLEERWMCHAHPGYAAYAARTRRFVPGIC